jgi:DNA-binding transcriptional LysR family regulator
MKVPARGLLDECNDRACIMQRVHIAGIDLNLAVVLRALLDERNVSRAARQLGLSQSATSHALGRLRELLQDPLFVRTRTGLVPTARAESMAGSVRAAMAALEASFFAPPPFDPLTVKRTFHIRPSDYVEYLIVPRLLERLAEVAPNVDFSARPAATEPTLALEQGQLDLLIQPTRTGDRTEGFHAQELWDDHLVGVMRRGHPLANGKLTLRRFAAARHALVAPRGQPGGIVDDLLESHGLSRRIVFTTPSFLVAPQVAAATDLLLIIPARVAEACVGTLPLVRFEPPLPLPGFRVAMFWHDRHDSDPAHRFVRGEVARAAAALPEPSRAGQARRKRRA